MKKIFVISMLIGLIFKANLVMARTISIIQNAPSSYNQNYENNIYGRDLKMVERYLFGRVYPDENINSRLSRIEKDLFNKTYNSMNIATRMNNIMANYRNDYDGNYLSGFYDNSTPINRLRNRFIGQPTGFTPPILNTPFSSNSYYPNFNKSVITNRGYSYNNSIPMTGGAGIQMLP